MVRCVSCQNQLFNDVRFERCKYTVYEGYQCGSRPMSFIFEEYDINYIDFFSLDVEGAEYEVLKTINFDVVRIGVLIYELDKLSSTQSDESIAKEAAIHRLLTETASMFRVPSDAKDLPYCIPEDRRRTIHGSAVYVSEEFRDDICDSEKNIIKTLKDSNKLKRRKKRREDRRYKRKTIE